MSRAWWLAFIVTIAAMAGLGTMACGGGGGQAPTPELTLVSGTVVPGTAVVSTVVPSTPFPLPTITGNHVEYPSKGYSVEFPEGWTVDSNVLTYGGVTADAFFAPEEVAGVQASISVSREDLSDVLSPETYLEEKVKTVQAIGAEGLDVRGGSTVAGREASILNYGLTRDSVRLEKRDVIFVGGGHGWVITLTIPAGQGETFYPLFDAFLGSFELLASAQPTPTSPPG
jgi:hypothetical protein